MIERLRRTLGRRSGTEAEDARIRLEGHPGRGTVVAVRPTGRADRGRHEVDLTLDVYLGRSRTFQVTIRPWVSDPERVRLVPGQAVPVAADHAEPGHVVLALEMDEIRSIGGLSPVAGGPGGPVSRPATPAERERDR